MKCLYIFCLMLMFACPQYAMEPYKPKNAKYPKCETGEKYCEWTYDALNFFGVKHPLNIPVKPISKKKLWGLYDFNENAIYINEESLEAGGTEVDQIKTCAHEAAHASLANADLRREKFLAMGTAITGSVIAFFGLPFLMSTIYSCAPHLGEAVVSWIEQTTDLNVTSTAMLYSSSIFAGTLGLQATEKYRNDYTSRSEEYWADKKAAEYLVHRGKAVQYLKEWEPWLNETVQDKRTKKTVLLGDRTDGRHPSVREMCTFLKEALKAQKNEKAS